MTDKRNRKILITSGPTRMPLDAIRYLSNKSTGHFGTLLAEEALQKGADVTFVYGKGSMTPRPAKGLRCLEVITNTDVANVLRQELKKADYDGVIHAMALLDFQAKEVGRIKTRTRKGVWHLELIPTPKIVLQIKKWAPKTKLVAFKLEVGVSQKVLLERGRCLLKEARADFVLANKLRAGADSAHVGWLLDSEGTLVAREQGKEKLAKTVIARLF